MKYENLVKFETEGDYEYEYEVFISKLDEIYNLFPFKSAYGTYNCHGEINIVFSNFNKLFGTINSEPFNITFLVNNNEYVLDIHPFDRMGGLYLAKFIDSLYKIYNEENLVSLVISLDGYAVKSLKIHKRDLEYYKFSILNGVQEEGKRINREILKPLS
jgi:hypothetical protein